MNRRRRNMSIQTKPLRVAAVDDYESVPVNAKPTLETKVAAEEFCDMFDKALKRDIIYARPIYSICPELSRRWNLDFERRWS